MRVAIYCRVSTANQEDGSSLETQEASCRTYAAERGWTVTAVYREVFTGAELFDRPQLSKLRESVRKHEVDVVVSHALDRLTRNQAHLGVILSEADYAGVAIELVTERLEDTPEGRLLQSVRGFVAEIERLKIAERTGRGKKARAAQGKLLPGRAAPYGYRWRSPERAALDIDSVDGPVVQRIFQEVAQGRTLRGIAARLNAEGILTPSGLNRWGSSTMAGILHRRSYLGEAVAWRYGTEKRKGCRDRIVVRPPDEHIALPEGTIPQLIEQEVFDAVQAILARNKAQATRNNRNPTATLLRGGYAKCAYCGTSLTVITSKGITYYAHSARAIDRYDCPRTKIKAERVDTDVWQRVQYILTDPTVIASELGRVGNEDMTRADIVAIDLRLQELDRKRTNLVRRLALIEDDDTAALVAVEVNALAAQKLVLQAERDTLEQRSAQLQVAQEKIRDLQGWCRHVSTGLEMLDHQERQHVLDALGVQVRLYHSNHDIRYEITASLPLEGREGSIVSTVPRACGGCACSSAARRAALA